MIEPNAISEKVGKKVADVLGSLVDEGFTLAEAEQLAGVLGRIVRAPRRASEAKRSEFCRVFDEGIGGAAFSADLTQQIRDLRPEDLKRYDIDDAFANTMRVLDSLTSAQSFETIEHAADQIRSMGTDVETGEAGSEEAA